jgi:hypothetical protein
MPNRSCLGQDTIGYSASSMHLSLVVKSSERARNSAADTTSPYNNPDAALTLKGENMQVYVLNHKGKPIMPCSPKKQDYCSSKAGLK